MKFVQGVALRMTAMMIMTTTLFVLGSPTASLAMQSATSEFTMVMHTTARLETGANEDMHHASVHAGDTIYQELHAFRAPGFRAEFWLGVARRNWVINHSRGTNGLRGLLRRFKVFEETEISLSTKEHGVARFGQSLVADFQTSDLDCAGVQIAFNPGNKPGKHRGQIAGYICAESGFEITPVIVESFLRDFRVNDQRYSALQRARLGMIEPASYEALEGVWGFQKPLDSRDGVSSDFAKH